jgi:3-oxoacyl-[acyl-carrier protein] reductase
MNLGIAGRWAIVCGSSKGLGRACAAALAAEGVNVVINGRTAGDVEKAVAELAKTSTGKVIGVTADVTGSQGQAALLAACADPDILVNNSAGPAPKMFADIDDTEWPAAAAGSMIAPLLLTKAVLPAMRRRRFGRIVNIASAMVTTPRTHMTLSAAPRAGLIAAMKAISLDVAKDNVTINNMLPERIDTGRQHYMAEQAAKRENITYEEARARQVQSIAARRLGRPEEFGALCAFICSDLAGFVSGQNFHVDGGSYPALI